MKYVYTTIVSPVGRLKCIASPRGVAAIVWENDNPRRVRLNPLPAAGDHRLLRIVRRQLDEYFSGSRRKFDVPLDFAGTDFQKQVWSALLTIPFGETRSYGEIAAQLGKPSASRAVGSANGKNPISIITPCHRVIGASGALTGFAGGLAAKAFLLRLENHNVPRLADI